MEGISMPSSYERGRAIPDAQLRDVLGSTVLQTLFLASYRMQRQSVRRGRPRFRILLISASTMRDSLSASDSDRAGGQRRRFVRASQEALSRRPLHGLCRCA